MNKRLGEFDYMRAVAAFSVIAIHVTGWYITDHGVGWKVNTVARFAVPLFIIMSGLMLAYSYRNTERFDYGAFLRKRFSKILIPYLIWNAVYMWMFRKELLVGPDGSAGRFALDYAERLLRGDATVHLYFIVIILQFYLLIPLLRALLRRWPLPTLAACFALTLYFQTGSYLALITNLRILPFQKYGVIPYFQTFPMWLFYFAGGMYLAGHLDALKKFALKFKYLIPVVSAALLAALWADNRLTGTAVSSIKPSVMFYTLGAFMLIYLLGVLVAGMSARADGAAKWLSEQSFIIYLSHVALIEIIKNYSHVRFLEPLVYARWGMYFSLALTCVLSVAFAWLVSLMPFASALGGVRSRIYEKRAEKSPQAG